MTRFALMAFVLAGSTLPAVAQNNGIGDGLQTGIDQIVIEPIDESNLGFGGGLSFEDLQDTSNNGLQSGLNDITTQTQHSVSSGTGGRLRALDKLTGEVIDLSVASGQRATFGRMSVFLGDCRYPKGNPSGDAYAYLTVAVEGMSDAAFSGWMVASSPALNAMDHARYDIWALTCNTS